MIRVGLAVAPPCALAAAQPLSRLRGREGGLWTPRSRLPDFSGAGDRRGGISVPSVAATHDVRDFGAEPGGRTDPRPGGAR